MLEDRSKTVSMALSLSGKNRAGSESSRQLIHDVQSSSWHIKTILPDSEQQ